MIGAASDQLSELLDLLSAAARIEADRFEPLGCGRERARASWRMPPPRESRTAGRPSRATASRVRADPDWGATSLSRPRGVPPAATAASRQITISAGRADDRDLRRSSRDAGAIALGDDLRDFAAAVGARVLQTGGGRRSSSTVRGPPSPLPAGGD